MLLQMDFLPSHKELILKDMISLNKTCSSNKILYCNMLVQLRLLSISTQPSEKSNTFYFLERTLKDKLKNT